MLTYDLRPTNQVSALQTMASLTVAAVSKLLSLRTELEDTLKCNYCDEILQKARTLNCPHHVCESCAVRQQTEHGACKHCMCSYYRKEITSNVVVNNIVETFHDLAANIERAAQLLGVQTDGKYEAAVSDDEEEEEEGDESVADDDDGDDVTLDLEMDRDPIDDATADLNDDFCGENEENEDIGNGRKRKRTPSLDRASGKRQSATLKKRKLSNMNLDLDNIDTNYCNEIVFGSGRGDDDEDDADSEEESFWTPNQICITGYDKTTAAKFAKYANALGIELSNKWSVQSTDILISKSNIQNGKPQITFKVLASILRNIPVVKETFLEESYERGKILDPMRYICNYQRVGDHRLFEGLSILFATTKMKTERLRILLNLGSANVLQSQSELQDKDPSKLNERIMICMQETEAHRARQLSKEYNCRVISESWVIKCIYPDDVNEGNMCLTRKPTEPYVNYYDMDPIEHRIDFQEFDLTLRAWDDEESSDEDHSDYDDDDHMAYA